MSRINQIWIFVIFVFALFLVGCLGDDRPSVCTDITEPSLLCEIAVEHGVRLETVGNTLIIVNSVAIAKGAYSEADAEEVILKLIDGLEGSLTYSLFRDKLITLTADYPGLLGVADVYLKEFGIAQNIYPADRDILNAWLKERLD